MDAENVERWNRALLADPDRMDWLLSQRGITKETVQACKLGYTGADLSLPPLNRYRYSIPVLDGQRTLCAVRLYQWQRDDEGDAPGGKMRWSRKLDGPSPIYDPFDSLASSDEILICEGELDTILACQKGFAAVTGTLGAASWGKSWTPLFAGKSVSVAYDRDDAGEEGAAKVAATLRGVASSVRIVVIPVDERRGADVSDFFLDDGTAEELQAVIETTTPEPVVGSVTSIDEFKARKSGTTTDLVKPADVLRARKIAGEVIPTGFLTLDRIFKGGLRPGILTIQGGPGGGKTALAQQFIFDAANSGLAAVAVMADEGPISAAIRFGQNAGLDRWQLTEGDPSTLETLEAAFSQIELDLPDPDDEGSAIETIAERCLARWPDRPVIYLLDSVQKVRCKGAADKDSRRLEIEALFTFMRRIVQTTGATFIVTSEVNRGSYATKDPKNRTNALGSGSESKAIEYGSEVILHLDGVSPYDGTAVEVAKNRWGTNEKPKFRIRLDAATARFEEVDGLAEQVAKEEAKEKKLSDIAVRIVRTLEKNPEGLGSTKLREAVGAKGVIVDEVRGRMEENGKIEYVKKGWRLVAA